MSGKRAVCALIGAGMVAKTHVDACAAANDRVHLKAILAKNIENAQNLAAIASDQMDSDVSAFSKIDDVVADDEIDFAIIVTPPNVRKSLIAPLANAGKHILLEKPIGRNIEEAREIVSICEERGVSLGIVFQHRMRDVSLKARSLIESGTLGRLGLAEFAVPWWREQAYYDEPGRGTYARDGGGVLISQAIHTIDLGLSLTGPVASVQAMAKTTNFHKMESEDFVSAGIEFKNGAVGSLVASTASFPGSAESIILHFEKATLKLEAGQLKVSWRNGKIEEFGEEAGTGGGADPMAFTHEWHQNILEDFISAIEDKRQPHITGRDGLAAHELIDAIIKSSKSQKLEYL